MGALPCAHIFCQRCITDWLSRHRSCPICQMNPDDQDLLMTLLASEFDQPASAPNLKPTGRAASTQTYPFRSHDHQPHPAHHPHSTRARTTTKRSTRLTYRRTGHASKTGLTEREAVRFASGLQRSGSLENTHGGMIYLRRFVDGWMLKAGVDQ